MCVHIKILALFDDDELADPDWLKELYAFAVHIDAQCVGGCRKLAIPEDMRSKLGPVCRGLIGEDLVERAIPMLGRNWMNLSML